MRTYFLHVALPLPQAVANHFEALHCALTGNLLSVRQNIAHTEALLKLYIPVDPVNVIPVGFTPIAILDVDAYKALTASADWTDPNV